MSFIKESMKEFDHIVWPTSAETKKYFITVVSMITVLTIFLLIVGTIFSVGLFTAKGELAPIKQVPNSNSSSSVGDLKLGDLQTTPVPPATPTK